MAQEIVPVFDYASLTGNIAASAREAAARIRERIRGQQVAIFDIGRDLLAMKEALGHGHFLAWIEAEFGMTPRTAQNYMQAAVALGDKCEIVSYLPATAVYQLASAPEEVRETVIQKLEAGERVDPVEVKFMVKDAKAAEKEKKIDAKRTPAQRRHHQRVVRDNEKAERERQERLASRRAATEEIVALLIEKMGDDLPRFITLFRQVDTWEMTKALLGE